MNSHNGSHNKPNKSCSRLPLIPLSPLTQTSIEYAKALAQTTKSLSETAAADSGGTNSNIISLLNKDLSKERENLDRLTKDMQNVQSQFLPDLNSYEIAREIAYINCSLFRLVVLDKTWISNFDKQSNIVPLLDFHRYLSHSFAHQVIYSVIEEEEEASKKSKKRKSLNNSNNMITQLIQIAYILLNVYRDFSGCTAILTSLQMPEVQRLETLWSQCPTKLVSTFKELVLMLSPNNNYEAYHHQLWLHTARFLNISPLKSQMVAVPFMHAHLTMIRNLIHTHSAVISTNKQNVVLSDAGKKSFVSAIHVLEFCQQHLKIDPAELERTTTANKRLSIQSNNKRASSIFNGLKLSIPVCLELDKLPSNPNLYHWLVSRAYLNRSQLHHESLQVEPLAIGEIELETEEEYDLYWEFFRHQAESEENQPLVVEVQKILPKLTIEEQQEIITDQTIVDDLVVVIPNSSTKTGTSLKSDQVAQVSDNNLSLSDSLVQSTGNNVTASDKKNNKIYCNNEEEEEEAEEQVVDDDDDDNETDIIIEEEDLDKMAADKTTVVDAGLKLVANKQSDIHQQSTIVESAQNNRPMTTNKPCLSPTAPEFIPQSYIPTEDDIIILTEVNKDVFKEDDDEEEVWKGYPIDNNSSQMEQQIEEEDEDEVWKGYPPDEEDEEEVWKGYPAPQQQQQQQQQLMSPKTIDLSTPSTPQEVEQNSNKNRFSSEEWKGYQKTSEEHEHTSGTAINKEYPISWDNNYNQLHAIGKAAARKMQYSLSNTENRKRLPSSFTPSAST